jgi:hypothetical protein
MGTKNHSPESLNQAQFLIRIAKLNAFLFPAVRDKGLTSILIHRFLFEAGLLMWPNKSPELTAVGNCRIAAVVYVMSRR